MEASYSAPWPNRDSVNVRFPQTRGQASSSVCGVEGVVISEAQEVDDGDVDRRSAGGEDITDMMTEDD